MKQVRVQLPMPAVAYTWHCPHLLLRAVPHAAAAPATQQSIDIACPPVPQQQTRRTLLQRANGTDGRTVGCTLCGQCQYTVNKFYHDKHAKCRALGKHNISN